MKQLKKKQDNKLTFDDLVATSPEMKQVFRLGARAAQSDIPVLIEGESGAGKELIARAIQGTSARVRQALRHRQLRRDPGEPDRIHPVRP